MAGKPRQNDNSLITLLQKRCFLETSKKNPLELLYFNTLGGGRNDILFVNLHRCLKNLRKFDKQHIKSSLVFVLVDGGCLAAIFL